MKRAFFAIVCFILLSACTQRMICPAYQSAFIYDQEELRKKFSYLNEDSTPKVYYTASKTKYLIAEPISYRKKIRNMSTVVMKDVNVKLPDSLVIGNDDIVAGAELDLAARSVIDSVYIVDVPQDSTTEVEEEPYVISTDKEVRLLKYDFPDSLIYDPATGKYVAEIPKYIITEVRFNVEQDNYMYYLRDYLILPDVKLSKESQEAAGKSAKGKKAKKGIFSFFKGLFKKKNKAATDSTNLQAPVKSSDDFDYVEEDVLPPGTTAIEPKAKEKKGIFSFLKKKNKAVAPPDLNAPAEEKPKKKRKVKKVKAEDPKPEEEKKKEEDDGF
jgi:hypothetical protein